MGLSNDQEEWFQLIEKNEVNAVEEMMEENEEILLSKWSSQIPYPESTCTYGPAALGENTIGMNALHFALFSCCSSEMVTFFIDEMRCADNIDDTWGDGNTALHLASFLGELDYIPLLLAAGAKPNLKNKLGKTPVEVALDEHTKALFKQEKPSEESHQSESIEIGEEEDISYLQQIIESSSVFGRESFGVGDYMKLTACPEESKKFKEKRNQELIKSEEIRQKLTSDPSNPNEPEKVVVRVLQSDAAEDFEASPEKTHYVLPLTPDKTKSPSKSNRKVPRDSTDLYIEDIENRYAESPSQFSAKAYVKLLDITELQLEGLKADSKLYCLLHCGQQTRITRSFRESKSVILNDEFVLNFTEGANITIELRKKRSKNALKSMNVFSSPSGSGNDQEQDYTKDELLAKFAISSSLLDKSRNEVKKGSFVWQPANRSTPVTGLLSLQVYLHTNENVRPPKDLADCVELSHKRNFERTAKIWGEGYVHISENLQHWKRRYAKLQGGKMFTFEEESRDAREVIDFNGFQAISLMDVDECSTPLNFKVNTSRGHYYFYAESKKERGQWVDSILAMMTNFHINHDSTSQDLSRSSSLKSVRSVKTIATAIRS